MIFRAFNPDLNSKTYCADIWTNAWTLKRSADMTGSTKSKHNVILVELATLVSSMSNRGTEVGGHARYARRYTGGSVAREGVESIVTSTSAVESQAG